MKNSPLLWILPQQESTLPTSPFVLEPEASTLELTERVRAWASTFAQSFTSKGRLIPPRSWSAGWRKARWIRLLSCRTYTDCQQLRQCIGERWTLPQQDSRASLSALPGSGNRNRIPGISGRSFLDGSEQLSLGLFSSKTSRESSQLPPRSTKSPYCSASYATWRRLVTLRNGESIRRKKLGRPMRGPGYSLWPTVILSDGDKGATFHGNGSPNLSMALSLHPGQLRKEPSSMTTSPSEFSQVENWQTPTVGRTTPQDPEKQSQRRLRNGRNPDSKWLAALPDEIGGVPNPRWVEMLMGFPPGHMEIRNHTRPTGQGK